MSRWAPPERSAAAAAVYAAADADREAYPDRYRLTEDRVLARATRDGSVATTDFADGWSEGLAHYLGSAREDGRLNAVGQRMVIETAATRLAAGARMTSYLRAHPERGGTALTPPLVIVGGWRTGTTFLFRLLAGDPRLRALLPSELADPARMAGCSGAEREARLDASAKAHAFLHLLNPQLQTVHDSGPRLPEECVLAMGTDLRNWGLLSTVRLDTYARWLTATSLAGSYRRYRQTLQILDAHDGRRFVLKAPAHVAELAHLVSAFPGAVIVHLHRDIVETIASGASLFAVFRSTYSDAVDALDVGRFQTEQTDLWLRRAVAYRRSAAAAAATFVDVDHRQLVSNTAAVLAKIYAAAAMEPLPAPAAFIADYHARTPRDAHGKHVYAAADFGLDPRELRERFAFVEAIAP